MQIVNYPVRCECCGETTTLQVNLFTGEHKILKKPEDFSYRQKWDIVEHYKKVKGFDTIPTWDKTNKGRALKAAKAVLKFFAVVNDPVGVAKECLSETAEKYKQHDWFWNLEMIPTRIAPEWILEKQKPNK